MYEYEGSDYLLNIQACKQEQDDQSYAGHVEISIDGRACCLPPSRRQAAAQALAGDAYDVVRKVEHDRLKRVQAQLVGSDIETAQEDLRRIMAELGMKLHARSESSHDVVMSEVLPRIREVMAEHKDRPEPVDPASVREGDYVRIEGAAWAVEVCVARTQADPNYQLVVCDDDHEWAPDLRKATVRVLYVAEREPEPDPATVEALAALLDEVDADLGMHNIIASADYARRLIRRGVEVPNA